MRKLLLPVPGATSVLFSIWRKSHTEVHLSSLLSSLHPCKVAAVAACGQRSTDNHFTCARPWASHICGHHTSLDNLVIVGDNHQSPHPKAAHIHWMWLLLRLEADTVAQTGKQCLVLTLLIKCMCVRVCFHNQI